MKVGVKRFIEIYLLNNTHKRKGGKTGLAKRCSHNVRAIQLIKYLSALWRPLEQKLPTRVVLSWAGPLFLNLAQ